MCVVLACACGSASSPVLTLEVVNGETETKSGPLDVALTDEAGGPDVGPEASPSEVDAAVFDLEPSCLPGEGCFLDPCESSDDCLSGLCVQHLGDSVCTVTCVEECPQGWLCQQVGTLPDVMFACVSPFSHLCRPCTSSADCATPGGVEDVCLDWGGEGSFCGAGCGEAGDCPAGYQCGEAVTVTGSEVEQCLPEAGICDCSQTSVKLALATPCFVENEWGVCGGMRVCEDGGLSECDALTAAEEVCNGVDDDCDGEVDDVSCDDGNDCTEDLCDPDAGCVNEPLSGTECTDLDVCTQADHCDEGVCVGAEIVCDDGDGCTDDYCDPAEGCLTVANHEPCDDEDPCTVSDTCSDGDCVGFPVSCECTSDDDCAALEDGDVCNGTLYCDLDAFPQSCAVISGSLIECDEPQGPGEECLAASCDPLTGECTFESANEGKLCDDGNACTLGESCGDGVCAGGAPTNCNDGNPCTDDYCDTGTGCVHLENGDPCDDGNVCTTADTCGGGICVAGPGLDCEDENQCTTDVCDSQIGCVYADTVGECDDGNSCTSGDHCVEGQCAFAGLVDCDDGNGCTDDWCEPDAGCGHAPNTAPCDDGNSCTAGDSCAGGQCLGGAALNCNDGNICTDDTCDPESGCAYEINDNPCNDGNPCSTGDQCVNGECTGSGELNCEDGNVCTTDSCDLLFGCVHSFNDDDCSDGNPCTTEDACSGGACVGSGNLDCTDGNPCTDDSCSPEVGCVYSNNAAACTDNNDCTLGDLCSAGVCVPGVLQNCDDGNVCTNDECDAVAGCVFSTNSVPCDDGNACTTEDTCENGACGGGPELDCDDQNVCTVDVCLWDEGCSFFPVAAGADTGVCSQCDGAGEEETPADDEECGEIDCDELDEYYVSGDASAEATNFCMLRDYSDLTSGRCGGPGECHEPNGEACADFSESVVAECGECSYCEDSQCADFPNGTACGAGKTCQQAVCEKDQTVLLLHMDDDGLTDSSSAAHATTKHGGIARSSVQSKFGGYSAHLDGSGYLSIAASQDWHLPGDWTVDFWMFDEDPASGWHAPMSIGSGYPAGGVEILIQGHKFYISDGTNHYDQFGGGGEVSANSWHHVAIVKHGGTLSYYKDGNLVQSRANNQAYGANVGSYIGIEHPCVCYYFKGYLDEFRVSKGIARWTSTFEPPTEPY